MGAAGPCLATAQFPGKLSMGVGCKGGQHHPPLGLPLLLVPRGDPETFGGGGSLNGRG